MLAARGASFVLAFRNIGLMPDAGSTHLLPLLVGVVALPIIIRGLGKDAFGAFQLAWVVLGYFAMFDLGMGRVADGVGEAFPTTFSVRICT